MNRKFTWRFLSIALFVFALISGASLDANAQAGTNIALIGTPNHSGGGQTVFNYGPDEYNDGTINSCNQTPWGWVYTNGWIEYRWTTPQLVGKLKFMKDNRPMTNCTIEYWTGSGYSQIATYNGNSCDDSITFATVTTTRIRMQNVAGSSNPNHREIEVYAGIIPCTDTPKTAVEGPHQVCPNKPFELALEGLAITADLTFKWEQSNNGVVWSNFIGTPTALGGKITDSITATKWYRCTVTCTNSNISYMTQPHRVTIAPFYYCYCDNEVVSDAGADIGNVLVVNQTSGDTVLDNGVLNPVFNDKDANGKYSAFHDSLAWPCLYRDTTYKFVISQEQTTPSLVKGVLQVFVDLNRDGVYNPNTERVLISAIDGTSNPAHIIARDYKIPGNAAIGNTGMRIIISEDTVKTKVCDTISGGGEVEDYIVEICHRPCDGPVNTGIVVSTDTSMCSSYEYTLTDTTYEKQRSQFTWSWQVSGDNIGWFNIANSTEKDTLQRVFTGQQLYYRVRMVCPGTSDTTYSAGTKINTKPGYKCYCYSKAVGGTADDSSDIGGVTIGTISTYNGGPHLLNPKAIRPRTDYTDNNPYEIYTDSMYGFYIYHTMNAEEHSDAKITIFMDFDNDHEYDIPSERVYTGFTSIGLHTLIDSIQIPLTAITDVPTGMRVVLNNDVGPNAPSDEACGPYQSGETEDFMVIFRKKIPAGVNSIAKLTGFGIHPNPNSGKFNVQFSTEAMIDDLELRITNVTGQTVYQNNYKYQGGTFNKEVDLTGIASGVYIVEVQADEQRLIRRLIIR